MRVRKQVFQLLLALAMVLVMIPAAVYADEGSHIVKISGLHSAQLNTAKLYHYDNGVKGDIDLLDGVELKNNVYEKELISGDYWIEGFDAEGKDNGGLTIHVKDEDSQDFKVQRIYDLKAGNSGWAKDRDYEIIVSVKGKDGTDRHSTVGETINYGNATYSTLFLAGDEVSATFTPIGDKAEGYVPVTVKKSGNQTNMNTNLTTTIPAGIAVNVTAPKDSTIVIGDYQSNKYTYFDATGTEAVGEENMVAHFKLPNSITGQRFVRVQNPKGVTYWNFDQIKTAKDISVSEADLHMNDNAFTKDTVYRFDKNINDVGNIYMNINSKGYMDLKKGSSYELNIFRNWQAIESFANSKIALPDMHYQVVDVNGEDSDVVSITPDTHNSAVAEMKGNRAGTAIVLVTYDAMTDTAGAGGMVSSTGKVGPQFSAIWPELTGVFVVTVDKDGSSIKTNMMMERSLDKQGKMAYTNLDSEHDTLYYLGTDGASYQFTPEKGVSVSVARSTVDSKMSFHGFSKDGVSVDAESGEVTVRGLKTGRHIIKVEKDGLATYQIINARQAILEMKDADGKNLDENSKIKTGEKVTLQFGNLLNPCEKLAAIYNRNTKLAYTGEDATIYRSAPGGNFGVYDFSGNSERQKLELTLPKYWDKDTYTLSSGVLESNGFGSQPGAHRGFRYATGQAANLNAEAVGGVLSRLPEVTLRVETPNYIQGKLIFQDEEGRTVDPSKVEVLLKDKGGNVRPVDEEGKFTGFAEEFSYVLYAGGYMYNKGSLTLSEGEDNTFKVTLKSASKNAWDGRSLTEPEKNSDGIYEIQNGDEMAWFSKENQNGKKVSAILTADIDLAGYPWNNNDTNGKSCTILDGNGHKVYNLNASNGLFGSIGKGSVLKDLTVEGQITESKGEKGGIVGYAKEASIEKCVNKARIVGNGERAGGIVGVFSDSTLKNCANYADVEGGSAVGGIAGSVSGGILTGSLNKGQVSGINYVGGVFGQSNSTCEFSNCYNTGTVEAKDSYAGGIGGYYSGPSYGSGEGQVRSCYNIGVIKARESANGVFGIYTPDKASASQVYYLQGSASQDSIGRMLTPSQLKEADLELGTNGFGLTCTGYPRLKWEDADFHKMNESPNVVKATCTEKGYVEYFCSNCQETFRGYYYPALGHDFCDHEGDVKDCDDCRYVDPTCTEEGYVEHFCRRAGCNESKKDMIPAPGHKADVDKTESKDGYQIFTCVVCKEKYAKGQGQILEGIELPIIGIDTIAESVDAQYGWSYEAKTGRVESKNVGKDNSTASGAFTLKFTVPTQISFQYGVSSENNYDKASFEMVSEDGTKSIAKEISGEKKGTFERSLEAGKSYTFNMSFSKDGGAASGEDLAWIRGIKVILDPAYVKTVTAEVEQQINALPEASELTDDDMEQVQAGRDAYEALNDDQKAMLPYETVHKLENALAVMNARESQKQAEAEKLQAEQERAKIEKKLQEAQDAQAKAESDAAAAKTSEEQAKAAQILAEKAQAVAEETARLASLESATAKTESEKAKAESTQAKADLAAANVELLNAKAAQAKAETDAEAAKNAEEQAKAAQILAEKAQAVAESAQKSAEAAKKAAELAQKDAEEEAAQAVSKKEKAEAEKIQALADKASAEAAQREAEARATLAEAAQKDAEARVAAAEAAQKDAETRAAASEKAKKANLNRYATPDMTRISVKAGKKKATVKWKKVKRASAYQIYRATKKNGKYKLIKTGKSKKYVVKKLKKGKKYYFKVRSVKYVPSGMIYGKYSAVKGVKIR